MVWEHESSNWPKTVDYPLINAFVINSDLNPVWISTLEINSDLNPGWIPLWKRIIPIQNGQRSGLKIRKKSFHFFFSLLPALDMQGGSTAHVQGRQKRKEEMKRLLLFSSPCPGHAGGINCTCPGQAKEKRRNEMTSSFLFSLPLTCMGINCTCPGQEKEKKKKLNDFFFSLLPALDMQGDDWIPF